MAKSKKLVKQEDLNCLNCGYPFSGQENFCPECGQKNKGLKLSFGNFIKEVFKGFITWDAKFWNTIIPLIISPGKVSKDYIQGKRMRYANPFRFYLTVSIVFFLIIALTDSYTKFNNFRKGKVSKKLALSDVIKTNEDIDLDSIQKVVFSEIDKAQNKKDSTNAIKRADSLATSISDSIKTKEQLDSFKMSFFDNDNMLPFLKFQKKHPDLAIDEALDSLQVKKTFSNRFWYSRSEVINAFISKKGEGDKYKKQLLSYTSVALFILLPLFTLFLKLIYFRRKFTYVEHLVFVFHTQTVFFLLFTVFYLVNFVKNTDYFMGVFLLLFMLYLYIAMKRFYRQGYFKTFIKYLLANTLFLIFALIGMMVVSTIAFALY